MRTVQKHIYQFEELDEKVKEKVINRFSEYAGQDFESSFILDSWKEKLESIGFENPDIQFTGFYSQNDGASFTCKNIDMDKFISNMLYCERGLKKETFLLYCFSDYLYGKIEACSTRYYHAQTIFGVIDHGLKETKIVSRVLNYLAEYITDLVIDLSQDIFFDLRREYEYQTSEDIIVDFINANEYEFYADGTIYLEG